MRLKEALPQKSLTPPTWQILANYFEARREFGERLGVQQSTGCRLGVVIWEEMKDCRIDWMLKLFFEKHRLGAMHCLRSVVWRVISGLSKNLKSKTQHRTGSQPPIKDPHINISMPIHTFHRDQILQAAILALKSISSYIFKISMICSHISDEN